jgi:hypothetical protein
MSSYRGAETGECTLFFMALVVAALMRSVSLYQNLPVLFPSSDI